MVFLLIAIAAGVLTVLAPCILPLLPIIVGGSVSGGSNHRRAYTVVASLGISIILFTLALKASTAFITVPPLFWQILSGGLLLIFGLITLFPNLWGSLSITARINSGANRTMSNGFMRQSFWGDVIVGAALGPVFTSCSPTYFIVLATILPAHPVEGFVYLIGYTLGLCFSLVAISLVGQRIVTALGVASDPNGWFKRAIGVLFILVGIAVLVGFDKKLAVSLPQSAYGITAVEQKLLSFTREMNSQPASQTNPLSATTYSPEEKAKMFPKAPELVTPDGYLNTDGQPITIGEFKGKKVVLIDFWTYSCINCQRTLPYLKDWYAKYKDQGLVIIGVHTPEFSFEHLPQNVQNALKAEGITYPVVLDNEYQTWNAFGNQFWPHKYLIDIDGYIVYDHAGEGNYTETETAIQAALKERADRLNMPLSATSTTAILPADTSGVRSPETYFGSARNEYLGNGRAGVVGQQKFTVPTTRNPNTLYLGGMWAIQPEYASSIVDASITYRYFAKDIYFVGSADAPVQIEIIQDGVSLGNITIQESKLYTIAHNQTAGEHVVEIKIKGKGLNAYTFTFG